MANIIDYKLHRLRGPMGRPIGDNIGYYDYVIMIGLELITDADISGWGFGLFLTHGKFSKPLPWLKPVPNLAELNHLFEESSWPHLQGQNAADIRERNKNVSVFAGDNWFVGATQMALWDLTAKQENKPVHQLLGSNGKRDRAKAYGSGLCFPLSDDEAAAIYQQFIDMGMSAVKVKVGHDDAKDDIDRLKLVRNVVGDNIEISVDANLAWTAQETIERVKKYRDVGVDIIYVEDPLPADDIEGYCELASAKVIDIAAHDYITDHAKLEALLKAGAIDRVRCTFDLDNIIAHDQLAQKYGKPSIVSNAPFEIGIHVAITSPNIERIEFSGLAWNDLPMEPVKIEDGYMIAPTQPGHGFDPRPDILETWRQDEGN